MVTLRLEGSALVGPPSRSHFNFIHLTPLSYHAPSLHALSLSDIHTPKTHLYSRRLSLSLSLSPTHTRTHPRSSTKCTRIYSLFSRFFLRVSIIIFLPVPRYLRRCVLVSSPSFSPSLFFSCFYCNCN